MIKALLSIRLRSALASTQGRKKDGTVAKPTNGKILLFAFLYLFLAATFIGLFAMYAVALAPMMIAARQDAMYFGIFTVALFSLIFVFTIFETKSELFDCKDNELLLSMPIDPRHIVISRILIVLIYNYLEAAVIFLPAVVVYAVFGGSVLGIVGGVAVFLAVPLLATALASGVGYLVAQITRRTKRKSLVTTLASLGLLGIYFVAYGAFMGAFGEILEGEISSLPDNAFLSAVGGAAMLSPVPLTVLLALSLCSAYLAWRIISANYISIVTDKRGAGRVEYKRQSLEKNSAFVAMSKKEFTKFFSSSLYMLNSALGVVFTVVLSVIILVNRGVLVALSDEFTLMGINGREMISALLIAALVMMSSMNMPSASALSLEGDNLWIIKTMPISSRTVLLAKCAPHVIVCATPTVLASVLLAIACGAPAVFWPFFILTPAVTNILFALVGIALNTAFPKLKFDNETQPIKQSMSIFLAMTAGFVWSLAVLGVSGLFSLLGVAILGVVAVFVLTSVVAAIMYAVVVGPCARKFEKL